MATLFVLCNGANTAEDVEQSLNATYGGAQSVVKHVGPLKSDKFGNTFTFVEVYSSGTFRESRMDRLVSTLREDLKNRGEKHLYQLKPYIEWTIKLHIPKEPKDLPTTPLFR